MFKKNSKSLIVRLVLILVLMGGVFGIMPAKPVFASTLIVTNTNDSGAGSLRQAIADAVSGDTITFDPSLAGQTITLATTLIIDKDLTIDGSALASPVTISGVTTHDGTGNFRVFIINPEIKAVLKGLTITKSNITGQANSGGINVYNNAVLAITDCTISNNIATNGGGILNWWGTLIITNSTLSNNVAVTGGGIYNQAGVLELTNVVITNNSVNSSGGGGGIYNNGDLTVTNSTISNNSSKVGYGGGIRNDRNLTLTNSTVTGNSGGGIYNDLAYFGASMTVANSTISNNLGGGIRNFGLATVTNTTFEGNSADYGGGIYNTSTLTITNSTFSNNHASSSGYGGGGGINNYAGTLSITNSNFNGNTAASGGGIYNVGDVVTINNSAFYNNHAQHGGGVSNGGSMILNSTTISNNVASVGTPPYYNDGRGGGIGNGGNLTLNNTTIVNNSSNYIAGGIYNGGYVPIEIHNSILANNVAENYSNDCNGNINSLGYNLIGDDFNCHFVAAVGDLVGTSANPIDPQLGPLQDNGGPTFTHALLADSPALDAGDDANCPATDQRGVTRPQGSRCDIGAYEFVPTSPPIPGIPVLLSPVNGALVNTLQPALDWEDSSPVASYYQLQVSTDDSFTVPVVDETNLPTSQFTFSSDLDPRVRHYWRVRGFNAIDEAGDWSEIWGFTTGNPPSVPVLISPADDALVTDYKPLFDWSNSSNPSKTTFKRYEIQVDDDENFGSPLFTGTTTEGKRTDSKFTPATDLPSNTRLYWRVRAINEVESVEHFSAWSVVRSFRSAIQPPILSSPALGSTTETRMPTFDWEDVLDATGYTIQVSTNSNFRTLVVNSNTIESIYVLLADLPANRVIYWRVQTQGVFGPSAWSATFQFKTPK